MKFLILILLAVTSTAWADDSCVSSSQFNQAQEFLIDGNKQIKEALQSHPEYSNHLNVLSRLENRLIHAQSSHQRYMFTRILSVAQRELANIPGIPIRENQRARLANAQNYSQMHFANALSQQACERRPASAAPY